MITPEFLLSPREFDVLWHDLRLGRVPYPLDVPNEGATEQERRVLVTETMDDLRSRGLVDNHRLEDFLRLLADHKVSVDAVAGLDRTVRALAVSNGERAALAIIDDDRVGLLEIRETGIAREIVKVLPDAVPGPGTAVNVRVQSLQDAVALKEAEEATAGDDLFGDGKVDDEDALQQAGLSAQDAKQFGELASNRVAGGQFGVTQDRQRSGVVINWFDTHQGRYLMVNSDGWLSLSPTDNDRIATRIDAVLA
ncbi:ESX secretion-associated protein EspG [Lentzea flaviverrucosa]|uniref:EspG family protein n=1 Tax=Lentzea flaviverrucosa TaxID=200379 RepID=A0A1H9GB49_9PSEU|nr:ESX secretion-associated protein EspG [Lentzea flaviverrucosa]RDI34962.1 ESAT-6 protein secretion system EspG family protein [Lentzea flaviverrucosa]SEQ47233.1 EspG family protein [Lentzea flaviverrucosa]